MAETITLTYSAGSFTRSKSFPDGSGARVVAAAKIRLALPAATNVQVFNALADEIFATIQQNTLNIEREQARVTADAGVAPMPMT